MQNPTAAPEFAALIAAADDFERSWSINEAGQAEERFLLFFDQIDARAEVIAAFATRMSLHDAVIANWRAAFNQGDALGVAFNTEFTSLRLYVQYWDRLADRVNQGDLSPYPLYIGLKSLPNNQVREDVYICHPIAPEAVFLPPITSALSRLALADRAHALRHLSAESCIYTEIEAEGRQSFLATLRRADLDRAEVAAIFADLPETDWAKALHAQAQRGDLLHIAGGQDALKGDFTTFYFSCTAADLAQL